jgi:hypothetical protein
MVQQGLQVVFFCFCIAIAVEFLSWLLVYRTDKFKHSKAQLLITERKLEVRHTTASRPANVFILPRSKTCTHPT